MPGIGRPWASWDDASFWLWMLGLAAGSALAVTAAALLAWALLLQPGLCWWHDGGFAIATDAATWKRWGRVAALSVAVLATLFLLFLAWYCDGMLKGSGKAEP